MDVALARGPRVASDRGAAAAAVAWADPGPLGGVQGFLLNDTERADLLHQAPPLPPMLFSKTHKTASSTVATLLLRAADWRNLSVMVAPDAGSHFNYPGSFPGAVWTAWAADADARATGPGRARFDIIAHHAVYDARAMAAFLRSREGAVPRALIPGAAPHVPRAPFTLTVLREPGRQAESTYNWYPRLRAAHATVDSYLDWVAGLECVDTRAAVAARNVQAHDLGWYARAGGVHPDCGGAGASTARDGDARAVDEWARATVGAFDLVLLTERLDEGLVVLRRRLGGALALEELASLRMKDHSGAAERVRFTAEQRARAAAVSAVDTALYAHGVASFAADLAAEPVDAVAADLARLRALNARLERDCAGMPTWGYDILHPPPRGARTAEATAEAVAEPGAAPEGDGAHHDEDACPLALRTDVRGYTLYLTARQCARGAGAGQGHDAAQEPDLDGLVPQALCESPLVAGSLEPKVDMAPDDAAAGQESYSLKAGAAGSYCTVGLDGDVMHAFEWLRRRGR